jgi:Zn-finger nucleic acid-binding protein
VLDRCRRGHGLWFDKGELEQVISLFDKDDHHMVLKYLREIFVK